jgi:hypothetical protein
VGELASAEGSDISIYTRLSRGLRYQYIYAPQQRAQIAVYIRASAEGSDISIYTRLSRGLRYQYIYAPHQRAQIAVYIHI